ncbi:hypothetical protein L1277_000373 [Okibacterium sp. HSC-33S16]|nr:hypothetical protein [Okibacterium sp. HSC-33S16]
MWRQVAAFKDPFGRSLVGAVEGMATEDLAHGISEDNLLAGNYWDGDESSLESLSLVNGGAVIHNLEEHTPGISFDVLITSGPRDVEADTLANPAGPYLGPNSVFTCSRIAIGFETRTSWRWTDTDCDDALTGQLGPGAQLVSIHEFDG